jgi:hypothetical protein
MTDRPVASKDEIELIEMLRVVWKWKYLILLGTLVCAVLAGVISFNQPKVYRIGMVLQPPVAGIDSRGRKIYIDSPENIEALIEAGVFNSKILDSLKSSSKIVPKSLKFKVVIPKKSDSLKISYEAANVDLAIMILDHLAKEVLHEYNEVVEKYKSNYSSELILRKNEISAIEYENKISTKHIKKVRDRIDQLIIETKKIDERIKLITDEQSKYISNINKNKNVNSTFFYNSLLQQLTTMRTIYKNEIADYLMQIERQNDQIKLRQYNIDINLLKIRQIENEINGIQNIQIIKLPTGSRSPIRPKIKFNIMLAAMLGFFTMLFLAFFMEYLSKQKKLND